MDADGVALAAIQGLHALTQALERSGVELTARQEVLEARTRALEEALQEVAWLRARLAALEAAGRRASGSGTGPGPWAPRHLAAGLDD